MNDHEEVLAISMLDKLKDLAIELETTSVDSSYWEEEDLIKEKIEEREDERSAISMSSDKFHKSFSL